MTKRKINKYRQVYSLPIFDGGGEVSPRQQAYNDSLYLYKTNDYLKQTAINESFKSWSKEDIQKELDFQNNLNKKHKTGAKEIKNLEDMRLDPLTNQEKKEHLKFTKGYPIDHKDGNIEWRRYGSHEDAMLFPYHSKIAPNSGGKEHLSWSNMAFKKPVYNPSEHLIDRMPSIENQPVNIESNNNLTPIPNGFSTDLPGYGGMKVIHSQEGKPMWIEDHKGNRIPYSEPPYNFKKMSDGGFFGEGKDYGIKSGPAMSSPNSKGNGLNISGMTLAGYGSQVAGSVFNTLAQNNQHAFSAPQNLSGRSGTQQTVDSLASSLPFYSVGKSLGNWAKTDYQAQNEFGELANTNKFKTADAISMFIDPASSFISGLSGEGWTPGQRAAKINAKAQPYKRAVLEQREVAQKQNEINSGYGGRYFDQNQQMMKAKYGGPIIKHPKVPLEEFGHHSPEELAQMMQLPQSGGIEMDDTPETILSTVLLGAGLVRGGLKLAAAKAPKMVGTINLGSHPKTVARAAARLATEAKIGAADIGLNTLSNQKAYGGHLPYFDNMFEDGWELTPEQTQRIQSDKQWLIDWYNNPETIRRMGNDGTTSNIKLATDKINNVKVTSGGDGFKRFVGNIPDDVSYYSHGKINLGNGSFDTELPIHELNHAVEYSPPQLNRFTNSGPYKNRDEVREVPNFMYYQQPGEQHSRIMEIRKQLNAVPGQIITPEDFKKLKDITPLNDLRKLFKDDKSISEVINTVATTNKVTKQMYVGGPLTSPVSEVNNDGFDNDPPVNPLETAWKKPSRISKGKLAMYRAEEKRIAEQHKAAGWSADEVYSPAAPPIVMENAIIDDLLEQKRKAALPRGNVGIGTVNPCAASSIYENPIRPAHLGSGCIRSAEKKALDANPVQRALQHKAYGGYLGYGFDGQSSMQDFEDGGPMSNNPIITQYNKGGQHSENPFGGVAVDALGNKASISGAQPVASVEEGEVSFKIPGGSTFVFSNKIIAK